MRDTADLKRAIRYVLKSASVDDDAKRYVIRRARTLGHVDLLPTSWTRMTTTHYDVTLDEQINQLAQSSDASVAQLKTVYLRGVNDFLESDLTYGSATMYGLARVQRFINERGANIDSDLVSVTEPAPYSDHGFELSAGMFFSPDIVYASAQEIASYFKPGTVTAVALTDDSLHVAGDLGKLSWEYTLDTVTGEVQFAVQ